MDGYPFQKGIQLTKGRANDPRPATDRTHAKGEGKHLFLPRGLEGWKE